MHQVSDATHRAGRAVIVVALAAVGLLATAAPVAAECTQLDRWPSFRAAVPSARTIVVGVVEGAGSGWSDTFGLRIQVVLRGTAPGVMRIEDLRSGLPLTVCPQDSVAWAQNGDRLAIAFDARGPESGTRINAIALVGVEVDEDHAFLMPGVRSITMAQLRTLVGMPDTATLPLDAPATPITPAAISLVAGLVAFGIGLFARRARWPRALVRESRHRTPLAADAPQHRNPGPSCTGRLPNCHFANRPPLRTRRFHSCVHQGRGGGGTRSPAAAGRGTHRDARAPR